MPDSEAVYLRSVHGLSSPSFMAVFLPRHVDYICPFQYNFASDCVESACVK